MFACLSRELWDSPIDTDGLEELAWVAARKRHDLLPPGGWRTLATLTHWLSGLGGAARSKWTGLFEKGQSRPTTKLRRHTPRLTVVHDRASWASGEVSIELAIRLLERPLKLLLENRDTDWAFLERMLPREEREWLLQQREAGLLEPEHGGGLPEVLKRVKALQAPQTDQEWIERLRLWVLCDRDADPGDRAKPSRESEALRLAAAECSNPWPLPCHQLRKRTVENYVPNATVFNWWVPKGDDDSKRRARAEALKRLRKLRPEAADQLNMKRGLVGDLAVAVLREVREQQRALRDDDLDPLFQGLPEDVRRGIQDGFSGLTGVDLWRDEVDPTAFDNFVPMDERIAIAASIGEHL